MAARQSAATDKALRAVLKGVNPHAAARKYGVFPSTIYRALKKIRDKNTVDNQQLANNDLT